MSNINIEYKGNEFTCDLNNMAFYLATMWGDLQCGEKIKVVLPTSISIGGIRLKDELLKFYKYCNDIEVDAGNNGKSFNIEKVDLKALASEYLKDLGLKIEDIKGKRVLDIGAGAFTWSRHMPQEYIINLERDIEKCISENHICGDATQPLPFSDASFDIIISRHCMPVILMSNWNGGEFKKLLDNFLNEVLRCLKTGGIARLGPVQINPNTTAEKEYLLTTYHAYNSEPGDDWLVERERCRQSLCDTIDALKGVKVSIGEGSSSQIGIKSYIAITKK